MTRRLLSDGERPGNGGGARMTRRTLSDGERLGNGGGGRMTRRQLSDGRGSVTVAVRGLHGGSRCM